MLSFVISPVVLLLSTLVLAANTDAVISVAAIYSGLLAWATYLPALALFSSIAVLFTRFHPVSRCWRGFRAVRTGRRHHGFTSNPPMWLTDLSFQHVARLASDSPADVAALTLVSSAALVATALAVAAFRHRDIPTD